MTAGGVRYPLEEPFFVLATQNPIEMEGTYPLPEAQLDRFMFNVLIDYLPEDDEVAVVTQTTSRSPRTDPCRSSPATTCERFHEMVRQVPIAEESGSLRRATGVRQSPRSTRLSRLCQPMGQLGRRSAGRPVSGPGRQGQGLAAGPLPRHPGRHHASWYTRRFGTAFSSAIGPKPKGVIGGRRDRSVAQVRSHSGANNVNSSNRQRISRSHTQSSPAGPDREAWIDPGTLMRIKNLGDASQGRCGRFLHRTCTAARSTDSRSSSASIGSTHPATTRVTWTGDSTLAPTVTT